MRIHKYIPNTLTLGNLLFGCLALLIAVNYLEVDYPKTIAIGTLLAASLLLDLLDGMLARSLNVQSKIGGELDSLADMVSFGVVPAILMIETIQISTPSCTYLPYIGLLIALFSALRLAMFNVDEEQLYYFKGLPTPANALFIYGLYYIAMTSENVQVLQFFSPTILSIVTVVFSFFLVINIPLFSLKANGKGFTHNAYRYVFLLMAALLLLSFNLQALPIIILLYILTSLLFRKRILND